MRTETEIKTEIERICSIANIQNEGEEGFLDEEKLTKLQGELSEMKFAKNWSKEQTAEKRAAWNSEVKSMQKAGTYNHTSQAKIEEKLGFKMYELKKAVMFHK